MGVFTYPLTHTMPDTAATERAPVASPHAVELRSLLMRYALTQYRAALMMGVSTKAVESWLSDPSSAKFRVMPERSLRLLKFAIEEARNVGSL